MDINRVIMESIQEVLEEEKTTVDDVIGGIGKSVGRAADKIYKKLEGFGAGIYDAKEAAKKQIAQDIEATKAGRMPQYEPGEGHPGLNTAGPSYGGFPESEMAASEKPGYEPPSESVPVGTEKEGFIDKLKKIGEAPISAKQAAATAAAVAAGLGAVQLAKKLRAQRKKAPSRV